MFIIPGYNLNKKRSTIDELVDEYKLRIHEQETLDENNLLNKFISFAENKSSPRDITWIQENQKGFVQAAPNDIFVYKDYLSELGFIFSMTYSPDGDHIIVGHSTGLIQVNLIVLI